LKEVTNIKAEINEIGQTIAKINKESSWFFEKIIKLLASLKREKTHKL